MKNDHAAIRTKEPKYVTDVPACKCSGTICGLDQKGRVRRRRYRCQGCKRRVPWCFGEADDMPKHCDDCWCAVHEVGSLFTKKRPRHLQNGP